MLKGVARVWFNSESFRMIPIFHSIRVRFHLESKNQKLRTPNRPSLRCLFCSNDLPNAQIVDEEYYHWKCQWLSVPLNKRPNTLHQSLKQCSPNNLPNLYTLLKLFATIPLSSCSCERSASAL